MNREALQLHMAKAFDESLKRVFSTMLSSPSVDMHASQLGALEGDVVASLALNSSTWRGLLAILMPEPTLFRLIDRFLGEKPTAIDAEAADAAAELLNMVFASARVVINSKGADFQPAIPMVTYGRGLRVFHPTGCDLRRFLCDSEFGEFELEFSLGGAQ